LDIYFLMSSLNVAFVFKFCIANENYHVTLTTSKATIL
jgi:hypothetical protein